MLNYFLFLFLCLFLFRNFNKELFSKRDIKIKIVYYIYINKNRDWDYLIKSQINDIINSNILSMSKLYIVVCDENSIVNKTYFDKLLINFDYEIEFYNVNYYEYYGIKKLYDLALEDPKMIYMYIHTKGMVFNNTSIKRSEQEKYLLRSLLKNYLRVILIFKNKPNITKAGSFPCKNGWLWFNFFYIKGTSLINCNIPKITDDRYYYESYIGYECPKNNNIFSFYTNKINTFNEPIEAINKLHNEIYKNKYLSKSGVKQTVHGVKSIKVIRRFPQNYLEFKNK